MIRLWHRYVLRHTVTYHPALKPDSVIRSKDGRPLINVFEQDKFQRADAYYECSCGEEF
jgi:hypothetical protein